MKRHRALLVLYVDDDPALCRAFERTFRHDTDIQATTCPSATEALAAIAEQTFDVLLTDLRMPDMDGIALLREAKVRAPKMRRLLVTGAFDASLAPILAEVGVERVIDKPWDDEAMRQILLGPSDR